METLTDRPPPPAEPPPRPPRKRAQPSRTPQEPRRPPGEHRGERRRRAERRRLAIGILGSIVVHLLVLAIASRVLVGPDSPSEVAPPPGAAEAPQPEQMQAIELIEVAAADAPEAGETPEEPAVEPEPEPEPAPQPTEVAEPTAETEEDDETVARPLSPAERLRPRMGDPRLWAPPSELAPGEEPSDMDRVRERIAGEVDVLNDSIAAALEAQRRSREWIVEDDDGGRWGISPGDGGMPQLHLGDITIPLPLSFPMSPELRDRMAEWSAIQSQVGRQTIEDYLDARAEAMRERADRERRDGGGDGGSDGGGSSSGSSSSGGSGSPGGSGSGSNGG